MPNAGRARSSEATARPAVRPLQRTPQSDPPTRQDHIKNSCNGKGYFITVPYTQLDYWVTTMVDAVETMTGKRLAAAALDVSPATWWEDFARTFGQSRRTPD